MTAAKPISVSKPLDALDALNQKTRAFSGLTKRDLEEIHITPTHYPQQKQSASNAGNNYSLGELHKSPERPSSKFIAAHSLNDVKKVAEQKFNNEVESQKETNLIITQPASEPLKDNEVEQSSGVSILDESKKQNDHDFYLEKNGAINDSFADTDSINNELHHDHLPSASSLVGGVTALLSQVKSFFQPLQPSLSLDDDRSIAVMPGNVSNENHSVSVLEGGGSILKEYSEIDISKEALPNEVLSLDGVFPVLQSREQISIKQPLFPVEQLSVVDANLSSHDSANSVAVTATSVDEKKDQEGEVRELSAPVGNSLASLTKKELTDYRVPVFVETPSSIQVIKEESMVNEDQIAADFSIDIEKQEDDGTTFHEKVGTSNSSNLETREKVSLPHDTGSDSNFSSTQEEHGHEMANKMREKESEANNVIIAKPSMHHLEIASVTGSMGSSESYQSEAAAAALRVTHLLDELTATVGRLRLEGNDGKAMMIQLRHDVLADTNIHIVSTAKQMEVSFLTSNATSNLLLNTHLTTLQNHLNALCPGQVVNIQTQLTPSSGSSQAGKEQDHSAHDLASFDEGSRGNEHREE